MKFNIAIPKSIHSKPMLLTRVPLNAGPTIERDLSKLNKLDASWEIMLNGIKCHTAWK